MIKDLVILWNVHSGEDGGWNEERRRPLDPLTGHQPVEEYFGIDGYLAVIILIGKC